MSLTGCGASLTDEGLSSITIRSDGTVAATEKTEKTATPERKATQAVAAAGAAVAHPAAHGVGARTTPGDSGAPKDYRIGSPDVLDISVFKAPELTKSVQVASNGLINLPLVGDVQVAGRTAYEVEKDLEKRLGAKYLKDPQVSVNIKEFNSQKVTLEGAVRKPGIYAVQGGTSMLQAIATAGGLDPISDRTAVVFRTRAGKRTAARFDISAIRDGSESDPPLEPGDVVVVGTSAIKETLQNVLQVLPLARVFMPI